MSEDLFRKSERVLHKLYCRITKAPPGRTEIEVSLLEEADELIFDLGTELALAQLRRAEVEDELRKKARAVQYRDRVIKGLRDR